MRVKQATVGDHLIGGGAAPSHPLQYSWMPVVELGGDLRLVRREVMPLPASGSWLLPLLLCGLALPAVCQADPAHVIFPTLEVPDKISKPDPSLMSIDRYTLLSNSQKPLNTKGRGIIEKQEASWKRSVGTLCSGCGETRHVGKVAYIDPVAVLNATSAVKRDTAFTSGTVRVAPAHRVHIVHRRHHRSRLYAYYSRMRFAVLKWRKHHRRTHAARRE
jgi:hypothetical protein